MPSGADGLRASIESVLAALDLSDAQAAYRAIARASPGGLGTAPEEDVRQPPAACALRAAMALAAERDRIARLYRDGYDALFELGAASLGSRPPFVGTRGRWHSRCPHDGGGAAPLPVPACRGG